MEQSYVRNDFSKTLVKNITSILNDIDRKVSGIISIKYINLKNMQYFDKNASLAAIEVSNNYVSCSWVIVSLTSTAVAICMWFFGLVWTRKD